GNFTFALNAVNSTGDTYIYLSGPTAYQWISVGTGSKMAGSVMLIVYKNESVNGITLSTRLATGESQPHYSSQIDCKLLSGAVDKDVQSSTMKDRGSSSSSSSSSSEFFSTNIHCTNLQSLGQHEGTLSFTNQQQNFIYALGPLASSSNPLLSNSPSTNLHQHSSTGNFWVDIVNATSASLTSPSGSQVGVPSGAALLAAQNTGTDSGSDAMSAVHATFMLLAFVIIFPLGAVLLRWARNGVRVHWIVQSAGLVLTIVGGCLGIALSEKNDDKSSYSNAHQILGLIVFGVVFVQWALGIWHHLQYKRHRRSTVFAKVHRIVGPIILIIGFVNGFLGNDLSGDGDHNKWLGAVVGVVAVLTIGLLGWK
ncbi:iron reductase domain protein, partial [Bipolaris oryzae ATCC 44560]